jgi:RNA polymerase sigma-70 factor (ECF subfamily)
MVNCVLGPLFPSPETSLIMLTPDEQFGGLMERVLAGEEVAARELLLRYEPYLMRVIRRRIPRQIRSKFDSLDFAQDVWASFFAGDGAGRSFGTAEDLLAFLAKLAENKVVDAYRQRMVLQKHNVNREQSLDDSRRFDKENLPGNQPTPSQLFSTEEEWLAFLGKQPLVYRRIFILLREGKTQTEIAQELGIHARTVARVASKLRPGSLS